MWNWRFSGEKEVECGGSAVIEEAVAVVVDLDLRQSVPFEMEESKVPVNVLVHECAGAFAEM